MTPLSTVSKQVELNMKIKVRTGPLGPETGAGKGGRWPERGSMEISRMIELLSIIIGCRLHRCIRLSKRMNPHA